MRRQIFYMLCTFCEDDRVPSLFHGGYDILHDKVVADLAVLYVAVNVRELVLFAAMRWFLKPGEARDYVMLKRSGLRLFLCINAIRGRAIRLPKPFKPLWNVSCIGMRRS